LLQPIRDVHDVRKFEPTQHGNEFHIANISARHYAISGLLLWYITALRQARYQKKTVSNWIWK